MDTTTPNQPSSKTIQMPIGYRFCPTDQEIIIHYLHPKVFSLPLPATAISHSNDLFLHHPSHLPGDTKEKRYFFHKQTCNNDALNPSGYWKPIVKHGNTHKIILANGCNHPIGFKKSFVFHEFSEHGSALKTSWILNQFSLLYPLPIKIQEWSVCSIHMKVQKVKSQRQGPAKRVKRSYYSRYNEIEDDSTSVITDLDERKDEDDEEVIKK